MNLGDKVYIVKECEIRKVALVGIITIEELEDYLSSKPDKAVTRKKYIVYALVDGEYKLIEVEEIYATIKEVREGILEKTMENFTIFEN